MLINLCVFVYAAVTGKSLQGEYGTDQSACLDTNLIKALRHVSKTATGRISPVYIYQCRQGGSVGVPFPEVRSMACPGDTEPVLGCMHPVHAVCSKYVGNMYVRLMYTMAKDRVWKRTHLVHGAFATCATVFTGERGGINGPRNQDIFTLIYFLCQIVWSCKDLEFGHMFCTKTGQNLCSNDDCLPCNYVVEADENGTAWVLNTCKLPPQCLQHVFALGFFAIPRSSA